MAAKRTFAEIFLDKLDGLTDDETPLISNKTLRDELGWDTDRYNRVKERLIDEGLIITGKGYGGTVGPAYSPDTEALNLFVSYCHSDEELKNELMKHLEPLKRQNLIDAWSDRELEGGDEWEQEISDNIEEADIILLLVSIDFINSKYCYDIELERALERHAEGSAVVVPVILRKCMWQHTPFSKLQALPKGAKAVNMWTDRDEALTDIAEGVRVIAERLRANQE